MSGKSEGLSVGDVVRLRSGGPDMTVTGVPDAEVPGDDKGIWTNWFFGDELKSGVFLAETLTSEEQKT